MLDDRCIRDYIGREIYVFHQSTTTFSNCYNQMKSIFVPPEKSTFLSCDVIEASMRYDIKHQNGECSRESNVHNFCLLKPSSIRKR